MRVTVKHDLGRMARALESSAPLELLTMRVEEDMRPYVKHDTGQLELSARTESDFAAGRIVYSAARKGRQYASYAYYDEAVGGHMGQNPRASAKWADAAKKDFGEEWARLLGKLVVKEMGA